MTSYAKRCGHSYFLIWRAYQMQFKTVSIITLLALSLAACEGGDVNLSPTNVDNSVDNSVSTVTGGSTTGGPLCASYAIGADTIGGTFDGTNCVYGSDFVSASNPLTVDVMIPLINGVHIFQDSLIVGLDVSTNAPEGGTGPTLTIEAGNKLAFISPAKYISISRGSTLIAQGTAALPITLTSFTDAVTGSAGPEDVSLWGGLVINGNGETNECATQTVCNVASEGIPATYGGFDNTESSGILEYVIVKHTGFEVAPGNELNGITFNAVGSGTSVNYLETYSTFDDGIEFFGGAVDINNYVGMYSRDDTIDFSDGYVGNITNALVIHQAMDGNRCIEGNNVGSGDTTVEPRSNPVISNLTCITSGWDGGTHGDAEGPIFREGSQFSLLNSVITSATAASSNECLELDSSDAAQIAQDGDSLVTDTVIACSEATKGTLPNADTVGDWVTDAATYTNNTGNVVITDPTNANVMVLDGFYTATSIVDATGTTVIADASAIGAVTAADDWTAGWTYGLHPDNRGQALWFEN